jgi:hypothetical protein
MTWWVNMVGPIFLFPTQQWECTPCNVTRAVLHVAPKSVLPAVAVLSDSGYNDLLQTEQELLLACSIGPHSAFVYV